MNSKTKNILILSTLLLILMLILVKNVEVKENIIFGTELWLTKVFPSLFPMFILSDLLSSYHLPELLANCFGKFFHKIFHTSPYGVFTLFMSLIAGTPSSAYILKRLVNEKKITEQEASHLLQFTFFSNPLFLLTMLSLIFKNNLKYVLWIIFIHYISNIIIGLLLKPKNKTSWEKIEVPKTRESFGNILSFSISKALDTLLLILGTICFYLIISTIFSCENTTLNLLLKGFLELTQGLNEIIKINFSNFQKGLIALSFISFGGLSIHTQINCIISDTLISYKSFLKGRILHVLISIILFIILYSTRIAFIS